MIQDAKHKLKSVFGFLLGFLGRLQLTNLWTKTDTIKLKLLIFSFTCDRRGLQVICMTYLMPESVEKWSHFQQSASILSFLIPLALGRLQNISQQNLCFHLSEHPKPFIIKVRPFHPGGISSIQFTTSRSAVSLKSLIHLHDVWLWLLAKCIGQSLS